MKGNDDFESVSWIAYMSNKVKSGGGINLAQGLPGFDPPGKLLQILHDISLDSIHQYPPGNGHPELVNQICNSYYYNKPLSQEEVLIVQGATEAISLVYTYMIHRFGNNWSSLAFDPVYESYKELPKIFDNEIIRVPFAKGGLIDKTELEKHISSKDVKLVFVNSPGNPYGKIWTKEEFEWLFFLADKYDFYILLDAVYKDLHFGDVPPYLPFELSRERLFYVNSFSKMLSVTGWRVGYLITEKSLMRDIRSIHDYTGLCAPSILQYAISDYLASSTYAKDYLQDIRQKLSDNYHFMQSELEKSGFNIEPAGGGYFVWCRLPENVGNGIEFSKQLYARQKVGVVPGIHFSSEAENWIRINIAKEKDELTEALYRIYTFLNRQDADMKS